MRKLANRFLTGLVVLGFIGCGGGGSSTATSKSKTIRVSLEVPTETSNTKGETQGSYKSFQTDVSSVLLQIYKGERTVDGTTVAAEKLQTTAMTKDSSTGLWSIDLMLNLDSAPFDFKVLAYEGEVTTVTEGENTPIFIGEHQNVTEDDVVIFLTETDESRADAIRKLPSLSSVDIAINDDKSIDLTFNSSNKASGTVAYILSSVANDGVGSECLGSLFSPSTGSVDFTSVTSFESKLILNEVNCTSPKHFLTMTTATNDTIKIPFTVNVTTLEVSIVSPPVIESINVVDNGTSFAIDVVVTDDDSLTFTYAWSVVVGTGTFDVNESATNLSGLDRENSLEIIVAVTNSASAVSSIHYELLTSKKSTLKKTGQTKSYDSSGIEVTNTNLKDDGFYQIGITPNYTRNVNDTVIDNVTGLTWVDNSDSQTNIYTWDEATTYCSNLDFASYSNWRVPTRSELQGIFDWSKSSTPNINSIFQHTGSDYYWSSTSYAPDSNHVWIVPFHFGTESNGNRVANSLVRCVRGGQ